MSSYVVEFWMAGDSAPVMAFPEAFNPFEALERAQDELDLDEDDILDFSVTKEA
jgi:hypothetical protein